MNFQTALTPALSRPTGEGEVSPDGRRSGHSLKFRETRFAVLRLRIGEG